MDYKMIGVILIIIFAIIGYVASKIKKGEKQSVKDILLSIQHDLDEYFKSEPGKKVKKEVLLAAGRYLSNYSWNKYKWLKPIFTFVFNKYVLSRMIEENMPVVKKIRNDKKAILEDELIKSAVNFGITKGTELFINETKKVDVGGDKELTHESQLMNIARDLNIEAKDKGYAGAYAEFKTNFKEEKELRAGAITGFKF